MFSVKGKKDMFDELFDVDGNAVSIVLAVVAVVFVVCLALR